MHTLEGRTAVVTGAASGLGRAFSERFARAGMKIVMADIEREPLDRAVRELRQAGFEAVGLPVDVMDADSVAALARETKARFGAVHLVCNNAGVYPPAPASVWESTTEDWAWVMGVNFSGLLNGIRSFVPMMLEQNEPGHVVITASVTGVIPAAGLHGVSKHASLALGEALLADLRARGAPIGVSVLCPGMVNTKLLEAVRNRPPELTGEPLAARDGEPEQGAGLRARMAQATAPDEIAEQLIEAVRDDRFYVLTHADFDDAIRDRTKAILTGGAPAPSGNR